MEFPGVQRTEDAICVPAYRGAQTCTDTGRIKAGQREMRLERPLLGRNAKMLQGAVHAGREYLQFLRTGDAHPQNARPLFVGEKAQATEFDGKLFAGGD